VLLLPFGLSVLAVSAVWVSVSIVGVSGGSIV
jgi:hypothetical protein